MQNEDRKTAGVSLYLTLTPADVDLLRAAVPASLPQRDGLGNKQTSSLAQMAIGAIARALLAQGYQPQPLSAQMRPTGPQAPGTLPPGVIMVQLA